MSAPNPQPPANPPVGIIPSPGELPGARQETIPAVVDPQSRSPQSGVVDSTPQQQPQKPPAPEPEVQPQQQNPPEAETVEMGRFKAVQQIARTNEEDARAYRALMEKLGVSPEEKKNFDPQAEITKLRTDFESERDARLRENISHATNVPVDQITGSTAAEMQASADRALNWVNGLLQQANVPAAVPGSVVNSHAGPNDGGPQQITTREQLAQMSPSDRMKAFREGRCDTLLGKR